MIDAKDLRIGNLIYSKDSIGYNAAGIIKVSSISERGINAWKDMGASGEGSWQGIEPIQLTSEWLERLGFEKDRNGWQIRETKFSLTDKFYPCWMDRMLWPQDVEDFKNLSLKFVHQLQNLYYALTGTELTIKEKV